MTNEEKSKPALESPLNAMALLDKYYLHLRSALVETAAGLDRVQRAQGGADAMQDSRYQQLQAACAVIQQDTPDRVVTLLELLSKA